MSPLRIRKSLSFGPLRLSLSKRGVTPSVRAGRVSASRRGVSVRLPGPFSWVFGRR
jgi:hypothetical protein